MAAPVPCLEALGVAVSVVVWLVVCVEFPSPVLIPRLHQNYFLRLFHYKSPCSSPYQTDVAD